MSVAGIYQIVAPSGNFYIGSSLNVPRRFHHHRSEMRSGRHHNSSLVAVARKYGIDALRFEMICCALDKAHLIELEQHFIDTLRPVYNATKVARSAACDDEVRERMSQSIRKSLRHAEARTRNQHLAARAISKAVVRLTDGKVFASGYEAARAVGANTPDNLYTAIRVGNKFSGHYWKYEGSDLTLAQAEHAAKLRAEAGAAQSSASMIEARRREVRRLADGMVFPSIAQAARVIGCNHAAIHRALKTGSKCMGSEWAYV